MTKRPRLVWPSQQQVDVLRAIEFGGGGSAADILQTAQRKFDTTMTGRSIYMVLNRCVDHGYVYKLRNATYRLKAKGQRALKAYRLVQQ